MCTLDTLLSIYICPITTCLRVYPCMYLHLMHCSWCIATSIKFNTCVWLYSCLGVPSMQCLQFTLISIKNQQLYQVIFLYMCTLDALFIGYSYQYLKSPLVVLSMCTYDALFAVYIYQYTSFTCLQLYYCLCAHSMYCLN